MNPLPVTLSGGFRADGAWRRNVRLRELTGEEHSYLMDQGGVLLPAQWTTEVLRLCAARADNGEPLTSEMARSLTVGDREALILQLRRLSLGDRLPCVLNCPAPECGEKLDLELRISDILVAGREIPQTYEADIADGEGRWRVRFRLPDGSDQEAVAPLARRDLEAAIATLMRRLIVHVVAADGSPCEEAPDAVLPRLAQLMAELDPQAEIKLRVNCQVCRGAFDVLFDATAFFFQELRAGLPEVFHEAHLLAYHYHWGLREILGLTARERRRYLQLLEQELAAGANP